MTYAPYYPSGWVDSPSTSTPIIADALNTIEDGISAAVLKSGDTMTGNLVIDNASAEARMVLVGQGGGGNYSSVIMADDVFPIDAAGHYWAFTHNSSHQFTILNYDGSSYNTYLYIGETGALSTANNTLDDGFGSMTVDSDFTAASLLIQRLSGPSTGTFVGSSDGAQYSNFQLADDVYPLDVSGHYWAFSHRDASDGHSFLIYNYDGSAYTSVLSAFEYGGLYTLNNMLDDGSGAATFAGNVTVTAGGLTVTAGGATVTAGGLAVTAGGLTVSAGLSSFHGGTDTSGTAAVSAPSFSSGSAVQLSTTQDVVLMISVKVATNLTLAMGSTSSTTTTILSSVTAAIGVISLLVPKGWYVKATSSGTFSNFGFTQLTR